MLESGEPHVDSMALSRSTLAPITSDLPIEETASFIDLIAKYDGDLYEVPYEQRAAYMIAEMERFGPDNHVHVRMRPWTNFHEMVTGAELTDMFSDTPGQGHGAIVIKRLGELSDALGLPVYLRPACSRSRQFYTDHGFLDCKSHFATMAFYPKIPDDDEVERNTSSERIGG